ncbi:MAG: thioredoxin domain-containing protein [Solirubrobacterales bacterium]|nr:thioredoxin domain-containing protein [Solirubrobacterales bacterium]
MSGKKERERRREQRLSEESGVESQEARRKRLLQFGSAAAFLAIAAVAVLIVISQSESGGGDTNLDGVAAVEEELSGIPQEGMVLGEQDALVALIEFGDLQCPACAAYAEQVLPQLIAGPVSRGEVTLEFRNFTIIGPDSTPAGAAALAAGEQGRGWDFVELFYRNQGFEGSGYVTDSFLTAIAEGAGVPDIARWNADRKGTRLLRRVSRSTAQAKRLGLSGTPSFLVRGPTVVGLRLLGSPGSAEALEAAVAEAG